MRAVMRRERLRELGVGDAALRRHLRRGTVERVGYDRFVVDRPEPTAAELLCQPGSGFALCHDSAGLAWGLPVTSELTHVLVPNGALGRWVPPGVVVHQTRRWTADVRDELAITSLARTAADIARTAPLGEAVAVLDAALRRGADPDEVLENLGRGVPGALAGRRALALADPRAESPLESNLRVVLVEADLAPDDLQKQLVDVDGDILRCDIWYELGVDVEGDGFDFHTERAAFRRDRRRMQTVAGLGHAYLPFTWEDVFLDPGFVAWKVRQTLAARGADACRSAASRAG